MGNFMHQRNQETVFVKAGIYGNTMVTRLVPMIIAMTGYAFVYNFQVHAIVLYQLKRRIYSMLRNVSR
ncbi:hypothetical protein COLO4_01906 [Corchorus olitorius]|uniref:Uncharacterized protein n=1 Tax=Corchorus olitorius TaxID=93759 RepID=A0A1R3L1Y5_9ROSI|nr:hypothetical protein COLO4_01906 [Corchorus olitorius]